MLPDQVAVIRSDMAPSFLTRAPAKASSSLRARLAASPVSVQNAPVVHGDRHDRTDLGAEQVKSKKIRRPVSWQLGQLVAGLRGLVVAELQEGVTRHACVVFEAQVFGPGSDPIPGLSLALGVVIVLGKVLVKILGRRLPVLLWFGREHGCGLYLSPTVNREKMCRAWPTENTVGDRGQVFENQKRFKVVR